MFLLYIENTVWSRLDITWYPCTLGEWVSLVSPPAGADGVVVGDTTLSVGSTQSRAGVSAGLLYAGRHLATLGADQALRPTVGRGTDHVSFAGAHADSVLFLPLAVGPTRVWFARFILGRDGDSGRLQLALGDGVTGVAVETGADWLVPDGVADGVDATGSGTWVDTFVVDAGPVGGAVGVEDALGPTADIWVAKVSRQAGAGTSSLLGTALGIGSAGCWIAGVNYFGGGRGSCLHDLSALTERVSGVSWLALTDGLVVLDFADCVRTAGSRTGVNTLLVDAGFVTGTFGVDDALWSTVGRYSNIVGKAGTGTDIIGIFALRIRSTWVGETRIYRSLRLSGCLN